jgi:hypothetical protein
MIVLAATICMASLPGITDLGRLEPSLSRLAASQGDTLQRSFSRGSTVCVEPPDEGEQPKPPAFPTGNGCDVLFAQAVAQKGEAMEHPVDFDDSTPKGATKALQAAFKAGDEATIQSLTRAKTQSQKI